ncbi:hypothetical protein K435DRAFT_728446 [Dendrothele bispora CBS 962.96]|uniref:Uncharacterized protein n=1 Tax=Dendrothele bispora (strain CBS 962.96) TaxID=1314807 RepID=A0A4S8LM30_DENBC|nr:hypothetical protein K435DRAFT_728446 [Dendrothele bispora CBS 962.96]
MSQNTTPSLTDWAKTRIGSLYELHSTSGEEQQAQQTGAGLVFAPNVQIFHNHKQTSPEDFQKEISQTFGSVGSSVEWKECVEVPGEDSREGIVAGFLVVTRTLKFRIRAGPAKNNTFVSFSAKIEEDANSEADGQGDRRRIVQLFHTSSSKAAPVHLHGMQTHSSQGEKTA